MYTFSDDCCVRYDAILYFRVYHVGLDTTRSFTMATYILLICDTDPNDTNLFFLIYSPVFTIHDLQHTRT